MIVVGGWVGFERGVRVDVGIMHGNGGLKFETLIRWVRRES